ncbi:hypothetical protein ACKC9G_15130 [Pokkaliibacter sp. CJK22405]|uniref:hypothetical protein n=1 Tax=Pokkaliibacter sp. CJK22405 TaxID=3384615 RepID=UPI0039851C44
MTVSLSRLSAAPLFAASELSDSAVESGRESAPAVTQVELEEHFRSSWISPAEKCDALRHWMRESDGLSLPQRQQVLDLLELVASCRTLTYRGNRDVLSTLDVLEKQPVTGAHDAALAFECQRRVRQLRERVLPSPLLYRPRDLFQSLTDRYLDEKSQQAMRYSQREVASCQRGQSATVEQQAQHGVFAELMKLANESRGWHDPDRLARSLTPLLDRLHQLSNLPLMMPNTLGSQLDEIPVGQHSYRSLFLTALLRHKASQESVGELVFRLLPAARELPASQAAEVMKDMVQALCEQGDTTRLFMISEALLDMPPTLQIRVRSHYPFPPAGVASVGANAHLNQDRRVLQMQISTLLEGLVRGQSTDADTVLSILSALPVVAGVNASEACLTLMEHCHTLDISARQRVLPALIQSVHQYVDTQGSTDVPDSENPHRLHLRDMVLLEALVEAEDLPRKSQLECGIMILGRLDNPEEAFQLFNGLLRQTNEVVAPAVQKELLRELAMQLPALNGATPDGQDHPLYREALDALLLSFYQLPETDITAQLADSLVHAFNAHRTLDVESLELLLPLLARGAHRASLQPRADLLLLGVAADDQQCLQALGWLRRWCESLSVEGQLRYLGQGFQLLTSLQNEGLKREEVERWTTLIAQLPHGQINTPERQELAAAMLRDAQDAVRILTDSDDMQEQLQTLEANLLPLAARFANQLRTELASAMTAMS